MAKFSKCWYESVCEDLCENCEIHCNQYIEMKYLTDHSNLPKFRQLPDPLTAPEVDLDAYKRLAEIKDNIVEFVENNQNLYICSSITGNGKTSWAIKLLMKYFDEVAYGNGLRPRGLFVHIPTLLLQLKDFNNQSPELQQLKKLLLTVDLVVWDDIGGLALSQYDYNQLLMYMDSRLNAGLSNIYTSNLPSASAIDSKLGVKISSRILSKNTEIIEFKGGDNR